MLFYYNHIEVFLIHFMNNWSLQVDEILLIFFNTIILHLYKDIENKLQGNYYFTENIFARDTY